MFGILLLHEQRPGRPRPARVRYRGGLAAESGPAFSGLPDLAYNGDRSDPDRSTHDGGTPMNRPLRILAAALMLLTAMSCESTKLVSSWKDPGTSRLEFHKVLVMVLSKDDSVRRAAEDTLVAEITKAQAVASYTIFPSEDFRSQESTAKEKIKEMGFDGAVVMRMVDKTQQTSWVPGGYPGPYYSFYGYWGYGYGVAYSPGYMVTDTI